MPFDFLKVKEEEEEEKPTKGADDKVQPADRNPATRDGNDAIGQPRSKLALIGTVTAVVAIACVAGYFFGKRAAARR